MNLAEYIKTKREDTYVPLKARLASQAKVSKLAVQKQQHKHVIAWLPHREPIRIPDEMKAEVRRYSMQWKRCLGQKPHYKNVRRGGICHRRHVECEYYQCMQVRARWE